MSEHDRLVMEWSERCLWYPPDEVVLNYWFAVADPAALAIGPLDEPQAVEPDVVVGPASPESPASSETKG